MKKNNWVNVAAIIIWLVPIIYFITIYASVPQTVPLHFGLNGKPDRYGSKEEMIWVNVLLSAVSLGVYFLIRFLPKIDPKKTAGYSAGAFKKISILLVVLLSGIQLFVINASLGGNLSLIRFLFPVLGLFFAYLGNLMHSIKSNYFIGIRTPWTLEDEDTWRATHQLAGKLWFTGGIVITIATLLFNYTIGSIIFISITVVIAIIPIVYSYIYFKKHKH